MIYMTYHMTEYDWLRLTQIDDLALVASQSLVAARPASADSRNARFRGALKRGQMVD